MAIQVEFSEDVETILQERATKLGCTIGKLLWDSSAREITRQESFAAVGRMADQQIIPSEVMTEIKAQK